MIAAGEGKRYKRRGGGKARGGIGDGVGGGKEEVEGEVVWGWKERK